MPGKQKKSPFHSAEGSRAAQRSDIEMIRAQRGVASIGQREARSDKEKPPQLFLKE